MAMYDVVVVGGGVEGSATAYHLARDGQRTLLLDQFPLPHSRGSSHGHSRITRMAYPEPLYSRMMKEATRFWRKLGDDAGVDVFSPVGYMYIGSEDSPKVLSHVRSLEEAGAAHELVGGEALRRRFPQLHYPPGHCAVLDPNGGILRADRILELLRALFKQHGGEIRDKEKVLSVTPESPELVTLVTQHQRVVTRRVVLCCGPWASDLLSPLGLKLPLQPVRISVFYWPERVVGSHSSSRLPTFSEYQLLDNMGVYLLPCHEYPGCVKVCLHHGPPIHPDMRDAEDDSWARRLLAGYIQRYLPGLQPQPAVVETCIYTNTPDSHFILDTHPKWKNIVIGAGFSGHGFKLAPVVGQVLSQLAQGKEPSYDLTLFNIKRFSSNARL